MPITPRFVLSQTEKEVVIDIRVPHVRVSAQSVEVVTDGSTLHFSSPPYLLILNFPAELADTSDNGCATYDPVREGGMIALRLPKREPALWPDLDMLAKLMTPRQPPTRAGGIAVVSSTENEEVNGEVDNSLSQQFLPELKNALKPHYGFLNQHVAVFTDLAREGLASEMLELPFPDETDAADRCDMRKEVELEKFDEDRYIVDLELEDDYIYQVAMSMVPHWTDEHNRNNSIDSLTDHISRLATNDDGVSGGENETHALPSAPYFTLDETAELASIPYPILPEIISSEQEISLFVGLLDLLFAYVYDHVMTDGDSTIESSWTISTLSCTLSWLEDYNGTALETVMEDSIQRALIYPYLRNYQLSLHCWKEVLYIIRNGRRCVVRCLLQIRSIMEKSECHYLANRLYIDPNIAWIQRNATDTSLSNITKQLETILSNAHLGKCLGKKALGLNLLELERNALEVQYSSEQDVSQDSDSSESASDSNDSSSDEGNNPNPSDQGCTLDASSDGITNSNTDKLLDRSDDTKEPATNPEILCKLQLHSTALLDSELSQPNSLASGALLGEPNVPRIAILDPVCSSELEGDQHEDIIPRQKALITEIK